MNETMTQHALGFVIVLVRVAAFVSVLPIFRRELVPRTVRIGLVFALTLVWWDAGVSSGVSTNPAVPWLVVSIVKEACLGAALGFLMGLFLLPAQVAGAWISQELGLSLAALADPVSQQSSTVVSQIMTAGATLIFLATDLHHFVFAGLGMTFRHIPFGTGPDGDVFRRLSVDGLATAHEIGMTVVAPVGVLLFLITVVLFLLNRASPQLNLFSIGLPLRLVIGFSAVLLLMPETLMLISRSMRLMIERTLAVL